MEYVIGILLLVSFVGLAVYAVRGGYCGRAYRDRSSDVQADSHRSGFYRGEDDRPSERVYRAGGERTGGGGPEGKTGSDRSGVCDKELLCLRNGPERKAPRPHPGQEGIYQSPEERRKGSAHKGGKLPQYRLPALGGAGDLSAGCHPSSGLLHLCRSEGDGLLRIGGSG